MVGKIQWGICVVANLSSCTFTGGNYGQIKTITGSTIGDYRLLLSWDYSLYESTTCSGSGFFDFGRYIIHEESYIVTEMETGNGGSTKPKVWLNLNQDFNSWDDITLH